MGNKLNKGLSSVLLSKCNINCQECTQTATTCTSCWADNFLYNSKCYECAKNCTQYENDKEKCKCSKCNEGFYVSNYQCESCVSNCLTCTNSTKCIACKSGYFINSNGQCSACPIEKCGKLKSDGCQCETCADNYFMDNNQQCQQCSTQCKTCLGTATNCTSCSDNSSFVNKNNQCQKCLRLKDPKYIIIKKNNQYYFRNNKPITKKSILYPLLDRLTHLTREYQEPYIKRISEGPVREPDGCVHL